MTGECGPDTAQSVLTRQSDLLQHELRHASPLTTDKANLEVALTTQQRSSLNNPVFIAIKGVNQRTGVLCLISLIEEGCGVVTERSKAFLKHKRNIDQRPRW